MYTMFFSCVFYDFRKYRAHIVHIYVFYPIWTYDIKCTFMHKHAFYVFFTVFWCFWGFCPKTDFEVPYGPMYKMYTLKNRAFENPEKQSEPFIIDDT